MALMAISSGSSAKSIQARRIRMFVSTRPRVTGSAVIGVGVFVLGGGTLVGAERLRVDARGAARQGGELLPRHEPPSLPQRDQLTDPVPVPRDRERLPVLDRVHDLARSGAQIALSDLGIGAHRSRVALGATR